MEPGRIRKIGARGPEIHRYNGKYYFLVTLTNRDAVFAEPPVVSRPNYLRGVVVAEADSPNGPFELLRSDWPLPPKDFMTLDGTLYVDPQGKPWMVYAHEWWQVLDGSIEAVPLSDDLSSSIADPIFLFKGSDGPWLSTQSRVTSDERTYVAEGPQVYRTRDGQLLIFWSTHTIEHGYIQAVVRFKSGELTGPWEQLEPLLQDDSGHGMVFEDFEGRSMMAIDGPYGVFAQLIYSKSKMAATTSRSSAAEWTWTAAKQPRLAAGKPAEEELGLPPQNHQDRDQVCRGD